MGRQPRRARLKGLADPHTALRPWGTDLHEAAPGTGDRLRPTAHLLRATPAKTSPFKHFNILGYKRHLRDHSDTSIGARRAATLGTPGPLPLGSTDPCAARWPPAPGRARSREGSHANGRGSRLPTLSSINCSLSPRSSPSFPNKIPSP
jgi:hypothetical protein